MIIKLKKYMYLLSEFLEYLQMSYDFIWIDIACYN